MTKPVAGAVERFAAMGTRIELHVFGPGASEGSFADALAAARRTVEAVDDALTIHRPSPATALNEALMAGTTAAIDDPLLFDALAVVDDEYAATLALFDVAADRYRGGAWSQVSLDRAARRITATGLLALDFGGMGKGFALDHAAAALRDGGVTSALLSAGESSIVVIGEHPLGGSWPFAIPHPLRPHETLVELQLTDAALSISATVGAGLDAPERSATLRPGGGTPVTAPRCTAAIATTGTLAEMMSTALLAADAAQAQHLIADAPRARFRFDLNGARTAPLGDLIPA
ncbi:FAD:protein FMN transferase [Sphingomonas sp. EC-HK361]|uniref:FAD:protein FMN transferase n=1 Tax=Sphingomonas sp. EC-HK361 TaxID=2038397 RepID=UPI00125259A9|nr:FAD:protein FMN transferase [Sphingomonas sp. EC-HK361]VVS96491.1 FAD:protein FMN transferase [Sphingomonas sp. EC-HK361]